MGIFEEFDSIGAQLSAKIDASFDALSRDINITADRIADDRYPASKLNIGLGYTSLGHLHSEQSKGETS